MSIWNFFNLFNVLLLLTVVTIIHLLVIFFVLVAPFYGNNYLLMIHAIIVPFIMLHWVANDDTCFLTMVELHLMSKINGKPANKNDCISCRIMSPIYNVTNQHAEYTSSIYLVTTLLWLASVGKLYMKYNSGEIKTIMDVMAPKGPLLQF
jgi:hypothetical protein